MAAEKQTKVRLSGVAREYNVGQGTIVEFLEKKGIKVEHGPSTILDPKAVELVRNEFGGKSVEKVNIREKIKPVKESVSLHDNGSETNKPSEKEDEVVNIKTNTVFTTPVEALSGPKVVGKLDLDGAKKKTAPVPAKEPKPAAASAEKPAAAERKAMPAAPVAEEKKEAAPAVSPAPSQPTAAEPAAAPAPAPKEPEVFRANDDANKLAGPKIVGKIELPASYERGRGGERGKRNRIKKGKVDVANTPGTSRPAGAGGGNNNAGGGRGGNNGGGRFGSGGNAGGRGGRGGGRGPKPVVRQEVSDEDVQKQIKETLARLTTKGKGSKSAKYRRDKREAIHGRMAEEMEQQEREKSILKVTEFVTVSELATMMDVPVTEVITACMNLGLMVSINQRLDAEALVIVAEEFGYKVEFVTVDIQEAIEEEADKPEDLLPRPPIVTVMGHVDHGKTSLLDHIRKTNVIEGEAGGITQHIGAYSVKMEDGRRITFLDTPGHEAFTAMRARGAKVTDVAIIIIAADDSVMPQTVEAINHAQAAGVPIVFAINKIDKPGANPEKIKEELANMNYLVEEWGGKYQSQDIAAKKGINVDKLLEKVLLEAEILDLKANPNKRAAGTVVESSLDKGRGYVATVLVSSGTLRVGDVMLSGTYSGRVKAMFNERGQKVTEAGPSTPVLVLGLNGAPQAGDNFNVMEDDKSAREIANKREQLQRMQGLRTQKHITLDEIGRRIAVGNFKELNVIIKGDVDGSIEALTDSLVKLSTEEVQVNVIHKAVGPISESDILLAAASNAVIVGFQVRPSASARKLAEKEEIEIRLYSIIYDAINEIKDAIEGMLAPETKEEITCSVEVMEVFKITKVGTVAGCLVREGKITRNTLVRVIRDGIVVYTGKLGSLKRFKDDVKEVGPNMECGLNIENYNDIKIGDIIEGYEQVEVARKLS
ncbi:translation initiation factor IF-2 [Rikenella microfusus]|uniref:Translation initiation factor IF-2 n=2 Tax=Rikenella microfusus TaxID=28139 RepID=A0A379MU34_9BACT|nr:translation initiation factor IF-2 [Rikenella microfusus]SUE35121.1 Translation initiation factor IF-2 [Rikenella microfusus]